MKTNCTLRLFGMLLSMLLISLVAAKFTDDCEEIIVSDDGFSVQAKCKPSAPLRPPWVCTKLDLNYCLINDAGKVTSGDNGHFSTDCDCGEVEAVTIGCQCWSGQYHDDGSKVYEYSEYNIDDIVGVKWGYLYCFDHIAPKTSVCS